jgi:hypothetical protein
VARGLDDADPAQDAPVVLVASRDAERHPELSRAWGPSWSDDGARLTVCVEAAPDSRMARNLEPGSPVAATLSWLSSQSTTQVKGTVIRLEAPTPERRKLVEQHVAGFIAEAATVGVAEPIARTMVGTEVMTVTIEISERFDDTPGSSAHGAQ